MQVVHARVVVLLYHKVTDQFCIAWFEGTTVYLHDHANCLKNEFYTFFLAKWYFKGMVYGGISKGWFMVALSLTDSQHHNSNRNSWCVRANMDSTDD